VNFPTPLTFNALAQDEFLIAEVNVLGLSVGEDFVFLACVVLTQCQRVTDGRTDRQLDRSQYRTELCIASYADAL